MNSSSKAEKGADYERGVCRRLSLWVSGYTREDVYWRSAMSGGRATVKSRTHRKRVRDFSAHGGDIAATHELGHALTSEFFIDSKFYKGFRFDTYIHGGAGEFAPVWVDDLEKAKLVRKQLMVIIKANRMADLVFLTSEGLRWIRQGATSEEDFPIRVSFPQLDAHGGLFRDMLADIDFKRIRRCLGES